MKSILVLLVLGTACLQAQTPALVLLTNAPAFTQAGEESAVIQYNRKLITTNNPEWVLICGRTTMPKSREVNFGTAPVRCQSYITLMYPLVNDSIFTTNLASLHLRSTDGKSYYFWSSGERPDTSPHAPHGLKWKALLFPDVRGSSYSLCGLAGRFADITFPGSPPSDEQARKADGDPPDGEWRDEDWRVFQAQSRSEKAVLLFNPKLVGTNSIPKHGLWAGEIDCTRMTVPYPAILGSGTNQVLCTTFVSVGFLSDAPYATNIASLHLRSTNGHRLEPARVAGTQAVGGPGATFLTFPNLKEPKYSLWGAAGHFADITFPEPKPIYRVRDREGPPRLSDGP